MRMRHKSYIALTFCLTSCSTHADVLNEYQNSRTSHKYLTAISNPIRVGGLGTNETSVDRIPTGVANGQTGVIAYNSGGLTWSYWNGSSYSAPNRSATTWPSLTMHDGTPGNYIGDPAVAATGRAGEAAMLQIAQSATTTARDIAIGITIDGGQTVTQSGIVSTSNTGFTDADYPRVALDLTNNTVWAVWRGHGTLWLRSIQFSGASGHYAMGTPVDIGAVGRLGFVPEVGYDIAVRPASSLGQRPTIYVSFPTYTNLPDCSTTPPGDTAFVTWQMGKSTDAGNTFTVNEISRDASFLKCFGNAHTSQGNNPDANRSLIVSRYDAVSGYVVVAHSQSARDVNGRNVGMRAFVRQSSDAFLTQDYWIPTCAAGDATLVNGAFSATEPFCHQFGVAIGVTRVDALTSRAAFTWHSSRDSATNCVDGAPMIDMWGGSVRPGTPYDFRPATASRLIPLGTGVPWCQAPSSGNTAWGDYEGVAGSAPTTTSSTFLAAFADKASSDSRVQAITFGP